MPKQGMPSGGYAPLGSIRTDKRASAMVIPMEPQVLPGKQKVRVLPGPRGFWMGPGLFPVRGKPRRKMGMVVPMLRPPGARPKK